MFTRYVSITYKNKKYGGNIKKRREEVFVLLQEKGASGGYIKKTIRFSEIL